MFMVLFILDDPTRLKDILAAWEKVGVNGATILDSTGIHRHKQRYIPMRYIFGDASGEEEGNLTILSIVPDEETALRCLQAVESVVGDLDLPNTGVFAAWPLTLTKGVPPGHPAGEA